MSSKRRERKPGEAPPPQSTRRLGVLGTMVWDRVFHPGEDVSTESWGGLSYALEAFCASLPETWEVAPIVKVGWDRVGSAREYLESMGRVGPLSGVLESPFRAITVERKYLEGWQRKERILGTESPWTEDELGPLCSSFDALYLNFITGFEMELETALSLKRGFPIPIYADLHSLFLDKDAEGHRSIRTPPGWRNWIRAFDFVQMNEEEFGTLALSFEGSPIEAERLVGPDVRLIAVTLGKGGADYIAARGFEPYPGRWPAAREIDTAGERLLKGRVPLGNAPSSGDPSGCGDVWGATFFSRLLAGDRLETAAAEANRLASKNVDHEGAPGLRHHLLA